MYFENQKIITENLKLPDAFTARVTAVYRNRYALVCEYGAIFGQMNPGAHMAAMPPVVGDMVVIAYQPQGDSRILQILPRKTAFVRKNPDSAKGEQVLAANFDTVFLVQSMNQNFNEKRLERYLALAWQSGAAPVVVLTKSDCAQSPESYVQRAMGCAIGVPVLAVSAKTGAGMQALSAYVKSGKTIVLLGSSGVGKSTLVNALAGEPVMAVQEIRESDGRGRHTTTHRQMIFLKNGAAVIDTPGLRELGLWQAAEGLHAAFGDIEALAANCRFSDCSHQSEPGCAVREAIASGALTKEHLENYRKLCRENAYAQQRGDFLRQKQQRNKTIAKDKRKNKKYLNKEQVDKNAK